MNKHIKTLVIGGKVYVAWKRKMLHDVIGGHQEYIFMKRFMAHRILQLVKTKLRPRAVSRLLALRARRDYKVATLGAQNKENRYLSPELFHFWKCFDPRTTSSNYPITEQI